MSKDRSARLLFIRISEMGSPTPSKVAVSAFDRTDLDWLVNQGYVELWGASFMEALIMTTQKGRDWSQSQ